MIDLIAFVFQVEILSSMMVLDL